MVELRRRRSTIAADSSPNQNLRTSARQSAARQAAVPPTVRPSISRVGWPTPAGIDLAALAAHADALVELEVVADALDPGQHRRAVADQGRALDRLGDLAAADPVGLGAGEDELAAGDVDLPAAEALGVNPVLDPLDQLARIVLAGEHEGVGHARHRRMGEAFAAAVAGRLHAHQPGIEPVLQIALEDAVLDQHVAPRRRAFVVDGQRSAPLLDRAVVDDGHARAPRPARRSGPRRPTCPCG